MRVKGRRDKPRFLNSRIILTQIRPQSTSTLMLNRKHTEAMERLAKAQRRLADAEENANAAFLKWYFAEEEPPVAAPVRDQTKPSANPQNQPPKK
jgi:hypothetical protein